MTRAVPDFVVVGAAKSGTTALFRYLSAHPGIFIPHIKECRFFSDMPRDFKGGIAAKFNNEGPREWEEYRRLFQGFENRVCGDISSDYFFYHKKSIDKILKYVGRDVRIIILLRNPVDRIYSQYLHAVRFDSERSDFRTALALESQRERDNYVWFMLYRKAGMSAEATEAYLSTFPNSRVYLFEEAFSSSMLSDIQGFLGVEQISLELPERVNVAQKGFPRSWAVNSLLAKSRAAAVKLGLSRYLPMGAVKALKRGLTSLERANAGESVAMAADIRKDLIAYYEADVLRLEKILGRDLSSWRTT